MKATIITFLVVATVFALATLGYVLFDIIIEKRNKKKNPEENEAV